MSNFIVRLAKLIVTLLNARSCLVVLLDNSKTHSTIRCKVSTKKVEFLNKRIKIFNRLEKRIIKNTASIFNAHILGVPIIAEDIIGFILVRRNSSDLEFDALDREFITILSEQIVAGIRNIQLYEEQEKIILGSIKSLATILDNRLPEGYLHSPYFSQLVKEIGCQMNLNENQIKTLQYASMLHDAGKLNIPLEILTKPSKLNRNEFRIIKGHPVKGVEIIKHLEILKPIIPIILHHHERYDGKGYPSGLKGEKIPLGARIMALADAFEAMVYGRPYRKKMDVNMAIEEIKKKSGTQFDPKVVEAFLKAIKRIRIKKYLKLIK
jgi:HD-GYP domain-containing protein (c-di-GMP phosphodiesterase class II)